MRNFLGLLVCLLVTACDNPASGSSEKESGQTRQELAELQVNPGVPEDIDKFPATCKFVSEDGAHKCTCVLVGPEALLTAEHCVSREDGEDTGKGTVEVFHPELIREANCLVDADLDLAACRVDSVGDGPFERLSTDSLNTDAELLLTGLGCGPNTDSGTFHIGCTRITSLPGQGNNKIGIGGKAFLCDGDSGGPTYSLSSKCDEDTASEIPRLVAGINSKNATVTSVSTSAANTFICEWAADDDNAPICGCPTAPESGCREVE